MQHQQWCCLFSMRGCVTYLLESQPNNYLCLLPFAAGIDGYVIEG
jgi:hypothetical protein